MKMRMMSKKFASALLCLMLSVAMAFGMVGCASKKDEATTAATTEAVTEAATEATTEAATEGSEVIVLGEGQTEISVSVVDIDGNETMFTVCTDKETVGEALLEVELIAGEDSEYGLYVKTVNGITADYDVDQTYWAFYVNGEYASTGVDSTNIEAGATYGFKVEK